MASAYLRDLRDADVSCGGKAHGLSRLIEAGLPVPPGFVLEHAAFHYVVGQLGDVDLEHIGHVFDNAAERIATAVLPTGLEGEVLARAQRLGSRVVVRSSATIEDGDAGSAAGIFSSHAVFAPDVWRAIRMVWTSALSPLAVAYARRHADRDRVELQGPLAVAVIVQCEVDGEAVTVYTRPPGEPQCDQVLIQRGAADPAPGVRRVGRALPPERAEDREVVPLALQAERAIGAHESGADVELVQRFGNPRQAQLVQARPIVHPKPRAMVAPPTIVTAPLLDGRVWTWDVAHNPDPLSPAQIGLVERVERAGLGAFALRVCAGYLYSTPRAEFVSPAAPPDGLAEHAQLLEAKAAACVATPAGTITEALERYLAFYAVWSGELAPLIASARRSSARVAHRPSAVEVMLAKAGRGDIAIEDVERLLGDLAPAWDVAVAPFAERPGLLREAITFFNRAPLGTQDVIASQTGSFELAADLAERDDMLFARAQQLVRRALKARAHELGIDAEDVFWLPLEDVVAGVGIDVESAKRRAAGARAAAERAAKWQMPLVVGGPHPVAAARDHSVLRGVGCGPRVIGRVVRFGSLAQAVLARPGDVVVVRGATPGLAVFLGRCAALVSETGGLLDHGAAMAREIGIPCVVGCHGAWTQLHDGTLVAVDGDAGEVSTFAAT